MRIDLHAHSTASDGTQPPADVVRRAAAAGLDVVALTDHDTVAGHAEAAAALPPGLALVPGAEISCEVVGGDGARTSLHLLAYLFDADEPAFAAARERLRTDRVRRARHMVAKLVELGAPVTWERVSTLADGGAVGRPHVARALVEAGVVADVASAFSDEWIGSGGRAYVDKYALEPVAAIGLVRGAGGVAVFAHPGAAKRGDVVADDVPAAMAAAGLFALEVDHPDHDAGVRDRLRGLASSLGLAVTGSSDDHGTITGHRLGCETTRTEVWESLVAQATGAAPITAAPAGRDAAAR
ncbi:MAG TPA: PHP domain-containing protein [Mycobacteriales bacterium]|nr:PHP domain-containing protein [Mycobacteriales bacterium]